MANGAEQGRTGIRLVTAADRAALLDFLKAHWSAQHVFVRAPDLFDWQYAGEADGLNMILAQNGTAIHAVLGFIPMGRFDPDLGQADVMLSVWKAQPEAPPGIGLFLLKTLATKLKSRLMGAIGITEEVKPLYRALGFSLGDLHQAALFNPDAPQQRIAAGVPAAAFAGSPGSAGHWSLRRCTASEVVALAPVLDRLGRSGLPQKSAAYVTARFLQHPWYDYHCGLVCRDGEPDALCVWREVRAEGASILRIVDIIGDTGWLAAGKALLQPLLRETGADYIDLMQLGTPAEVLSAGGWLSPDTCPGLVLPNYFAPFERRTITISCAWKLREPTDLPLRLYRADSDQDRPNEVPLPRRQG
ncbi:hypothetical protein GWI72_14305 [Microvirga tunisiensis]|uniref:N-acetyltransferase domain-containing protein n=1 Tax=Pannonibacter tanglangensis TaxID=2750084 RepID=A0A7X5F449_9HYPH|nr:hypothetical protein [Pannonibacter sp. XCT-53]NBN79445.1 hypothetical protein [Pannonibacter sp. XCT-53]